MSVNTTTEFVGLKDAIKSLNKIDPQYRKDFNSDAKDIVKPLIADIKGNYPTMPLSGMKYAWAPRGRSLFPWQVNKARSGVKFKTSTRRKGSSVLYVTQSDPAGAIFEVAGKANNTGFNRNLRSQHPFNMWPTAEKHLPEITRGLADLVRKTMTKVQKELG